MPGREDRQKLAQVVFALLVGGAFIVFHDGMGMILGKVWDTLNYAMNQGGGAILDWHRGGVFLRLIPALLAVLVWWAVCAILCLITGLLIVLNAIYVLGFVLGFITFWVPAPFRFLNPIPPLAVALEKLERFLKNIWQTVLAMTFGEYYRTRELRYILVPGFSIVVILIGAGILLMSHWSSNVEGNEEAVRMGAEEIFVPRGIYRIDKRINTNGDIPLILCNVEFTDDEMQWVFEWKNNTTVNLQKTGWNLTYDTPASARKVIIKDDLGNEYKPTMASKHPPMLPHPKGSYSWSACFTPAKQGASKFKLFYPNMQANRYFKYELDTSPRWYERLFKKLS